MTNYQVLKDELSKNKEKLEIANKKYLELRDNSKSIKDVKNNLKQTKLNKDNYIISSEDKEKLIEYINKADKTNDEYNKLQPLAITLNNANEQIKMLNDNNKALALRSFELNKKVNEHENTISILEEENYSLRIKVSHLKKKFKKMLKFLHDKLFGWGKKGPIYNQVVNDFYNHDILDDKDLDAIRKDNYEL